jgi:hypothetical protein
MNRQARQEKQGNNFTAEVQREAREYELSVVRISWRAWRFKMILNLIIDDLCGFCD